MQELSNLDLALHYLGKCTTEQKETALSFINTTFLETKTIPNSTIPTVRQVMDQLIKKHNHSIKTGRVKRHKQKQRKSNSSFS